MSKPSHGIGRRVLLALGAAAALAPRAMAQGAWPDRPIRYIVPFPPGGPTDVISRQLAEGMREELGQTVVIENIGGANAAIGLGRIARAAPDGYTIGLGNTGAMTINPSLYPDLAYDPSKDFTPLSLITEYDNVLLVPASLPVHTLDELVALAKSRPEGLAYGSAGTGSSNHLSAVLLGRAFGMHLEHVPYRGTAPALADLAAGRISMLFDLVATAAPLVAGGQIRAIATTGRQRHPLMPNVPAIAETHPDFTVIGWMGVFGPKGIPDPIRDRLNMAIVKTLAKPAVVERLQQLGYSQRSSTPEALGRQVTQDTALWASVIRKENIKLE